MLEQITGMIVGTVDLVFSPLAAFSPLVSLFFVSVIITVLILALNRLTINRSVVKEIKDRMEEIRESLTRAQREGDKEGVNNFLKELMRLNSEYMKHTYKTLIISLVVLALFIPWLHFKYGGLAIALPFTGSTIRSIALPLGEVKMWIIWYILVSFAIGWILRKLLGFD